ncbi:MAG: prepilin peptidase [Coriobacteriia bacterium]|nr:prepilin peptidase [Coriobacteriia bacterium]
MPVYFPVWYFAVCMSVLGLLFGSFANVVIWRVPRGESIVRPGSHCPGCDAAIAWYDNIPVVSWLALGGRCRSCGDPIARRYPLVESASGVLFLAAALGWGVTLQAVFAGAFFWFLLVLAVIDLDHMRLPNPIVGAMAVLGIAGAMVAQLGGADLLPLHRVAAIGLLSQPLAASLAGALIGSGLSGAVAAAYGALRGRQGLGAGDVKLLGALGLYLGPYVLVALVVGSMIGVVVGLLSARGTSLAEKKIPFGPWLAAGGVLSALAGPSMLAWYLGLIGLG